MIAAGETGRPALVLLHGAASNALAWGGAIPQYGANFRVIAPDIPGEAGMSHPERPSWDNDDYALWLDDLLGTLGVENAALLGISFGGWIAAKYAACHPEKASRLVLLAPAGISPARSAAILRTIVYSMQGQKGADKMKRMIFGKGEILPEVSLFFDLIQQHYAPRFGSPRILTDGEFRAISCPVLMMEGGDDFFFNAKKSSSRLKALLPQAEIHINMLGQHGITEYGGRIAGFLSGMPAENLL